MIKAKLFDLYASLFARPPFYKLNRALFEASSRGLGLLNYKNDVVSGEQHFLSSYLSPRSNPVVIDIGAHEGSYCQAILKANPNVRIFAFEPHPATYSRLVASLSGVQNVTPVNAGCSSTAGQMILYDYAQGEGSQHASLHSGVINDLHGKTANEQAVQVVDLDTYASQHNIAYVDLLKIDTEGHELEVLKGALRLLREKQIGAIQFEFNEMNVVSRVFVKDFYDLLPTYEFYRLVRTGLVPLGPYSPLLHELFAFQNIIAFPTAREAER